MCMEGSHYCAVDHESPWTDTGKSLACMQNSPFLELMGNAVYSGKAYSDYVSLLRSYSLPLPFLLQHAWGTSPFLCFPYFIGIYKLIFPHLIMNFWEQWPCVIYLLSSFSKRSAWHKGNIVLSATNFPPSPLSPLTPAPPRQSPLRIGY